MTNKCNFVQGNGTRLILLAHHVKRNVIQTQAHPPTKRSSIIEHSPQVSRCAPENTTHGHLPAGGESCALPMPRCTLCAPHVVKSREGITRSALHLVVRLLLHAANGVRWPSSGRGNGASIGVGGWRLGGLLPTRIGRTFSWGWSASRR